MPKNLRPSQFDNSNGWENKSWADKEIAQNQYDLLVAQEKANELEQQRQENEKANAEKIAQATIQAGKERFINELQLELIRQANETLQRRIRLCDDLGMNIEDIEKFYTILKSDNQIQLAQYEELINKKESEVKHLLDKKPTREYYLNNYIKQIEWLENDIKTLNKKLNKNIFAKIFGGKTKQQIADDKKALLSINKQKEVAEQEYENKKEQLLQEYENKVSKLNAEIEQLKSQLKSEIDKFITEKQKLIEDFNKFRATHYSQEVEMLFEKLELKFDKVNIEKEGTIKDYNKYIKDVMERGELNT